MSNISPIQSPVNSDLAQPFADDTVVNDTLERLINICADGVQGHERSASLVEDEVAKPMFEGWARERNDFLAALQNLGAPRGVVVEDPGTVAGAVHRGWIATLDSVVGDDAVIAAAARGEKIALETYEEALEGELPGDIRQVVQQQFEQIREIHDRLENWETV